MASVEGDSALVLVTGASGFLGTHVVRALLHAGYAVRGTVRVGDNDTKVKPLKALGAQHPDGQLTLVEADLTKPHTWDAAVRGCSYVVHVASPFPATGVPERDVVEPAVQGTQAVLRACHEHGVRRVVVTSSVVAVTGGMAPGVDSNKSFSEDDWGDPEKATDVYAKSKVLAERAAWEYVGSLPSGSRPELVTILPGFMMGPVLCGGTATSMEVPRRLLERSMPAVPKLFLPLADVRDVAQAHVQALRTPECAGQRHIVYTSGHWLKEVAHIIAKEFKPQGYCVPTLHCPYFVVWMKALFDKTIKSTLPSIGKSIKLNNSKMADVLHVQPHSLHETVLDMCYSMIEKGFIKKAKKYHGPKKDLQEKEEGQEANRDVTQVEDKREEGDEKKGDADEEKKDGGEEKDNVADKMGPVTTPPAVPEEDTEDDLPVAGSGREGKEKEVEEPKQRKEEKEAKEAKETKQAKEVNEAKQAKEVKESKEVNEAKQAKEAKDMKEVKEAKEATDAKQAKEMEKEAAKEVVEEEQWMVEGGAEKVKDAAIEAAKAEEEEEETVEELSSPEEVMIECDAMGNLK